MLLCLDVGNTHILGGVFQEDKIILRFRYSTPQLGTSDQFGIFLRNILQFNGLDASTVTAVSMSSVVPACNYTINHAISQYFDVTVFNLQAGVRTGLNIKYKNTAEVGSDRIANAIGAVNAFPDKNLIIIDVGTATTFCAVNKKRDYLGGVILAGMRLSMEALSSNTAKLMEVDIKVPPACLGQTTRESLQRGLYFGHLGALQEIMNRIQLEEFGGQRPKVIATGGFASLFNGTGLFDQVMQDLVLHGLLVVLEMNSVKQPV